MYGDHGHDGGWGWGPWLMMSVTMLIFLGLVAWGIFLVWRSTSHPDASAADRRTDAPRSPEAILGERLARGEIDPEEYRARMDALKPDGP